VFALDPSLWNQLKAFGVRFLIALLILLAFYVVSRIVRSLILRVAVRTGPDREALLALAARVASLGVQVFGAVVALGTLGLDVSALVAGLGLTGFAVGFALKDSLSNLLAGAMILFYRPFRRGAHITVTGLEGIVKEIDLRYTTLETAERCILLPNSTLLTNPIIVHRKAPADRPAATNAEPPRNPDHA
jgi:small conductance mechanosensitive channel